MFNMYFIGSWSQIVAIAATSDGQIG